MNNFIFREPFLQYAVDWGNVLRNSGKFFLDPSDGGEGIGYIRVDWEIIEHVKANLSMMLEKDAFPKYVENIEKQMVLVGTGDEVNIPLGFNPDFGLNGEPTSALERVRRRLALKKRLGEMQKGTREGQSDPLFICMHEQKRAMQEFVNVISGLTDFFFENRGCLLLDLSGLMISDPTRRILQRVEWGPISYLGFKYGFTFTFAPFCSVSKQFKTEG
jgi:hypothetical protein